MGGGEKQPHPLVDCRFRLGAHRVDVGQRPFDLLQNRQRVSRAVELAPRYLNHDGRGMRSDDLGLVPVVPRTSSATHVLRCTLSVKRPSAASGSTFSLSTTAPLAMSSTLDIGTVTLAAFQAISIVPPRGDMRK